MSSRRPVTAINLGGEGEVPDILNQQRPAALSAAWGASLTGDTLEGLALQGHDFLICPNARLPLRDDTLDEVITNSVPVDTVILGEPGIQSSEILRVLAPGGRWVHDGVVRYTKP